MWTARWWLLQSGPPEYWPLKWARQCGAMRMAKSCKEATAANPIRSVLEGHMDKTCCQQGLFLEESQLKSSLPLLTF